MPRAVFNLRSIVHKWEPPFSITAASQEQVVEEGCYFDEMEKPRCFVFRLIRCDGNRALVEFNIRFTLKGHEHPRDGRVWVGGEEEVNFTYLWGNNGITKSLQLKGIVE